MDPVRKRFEAEVDVEAGRCVVARISTAAVDRAGEVLLPGGMDATEFRANPVVFWNHDYDKPVARCVALWHDESAVYARDEFPPRPEGHAGEWLPDTVLSLIRGGVVRGFSVGFVPLERRGPSDAERRRLGEGVRSVVTRWRKLEHSVAPLPANQEALLLAVGKGLMGADSALLRGPTRTALMVLRRADPARAVRAAVARAMGRVWLNER